ncbi:hypothetical protein [Okeania sp. SIO2B3]|uniref:hypothetical protein n=1 Tax=Okeania sp. SIO2B3 TaxID=2607784 RepID=UPI0013C16EBF|nr:hypothetical protein [Okeania sp. SIO2B3]NET44862.1 hypothetical protein [Okeania sp. SIO2B3]
MQKGYWDTKKPARISEFKEFFAHFLSSDPSLSSKIRKYGNSDLRCLDTWQKAYADRENIKRMRIQELKDLQFSNEDINIMLGEQVDVTATIPDNQEQLEIAQKETNSTIPSRPSTRKLPHLKLFPLPATQSFNPMDKDFQIQRLENCLALTPSHIDRNSDSQHQWIQLREFVRNVIHSFYGRQYNFDCEFIYSQGKHIYSFDSRECHYQVLFRHKDRVIEIIESDRDKDLARALPKRIIILRPSDIAKGNIQCLQEGLRNNTLALMFR